VISRCYSIPYEISDITIRRFEVKKILVPFSASELSSWGNPTSLGAIIIRWQRWLQKQKSEDNRSGFWQYIPASDTAGFSILGSEFKIFPEFLLRCHRPYKIEILRMDTPLVDPKELI
jgi:hypothetical protein